MSAKPNSQPNPPHVITKDEALRIQLANLAIEGIAVHSGHNGLGSNEGNTFRS
jgi:hypothetical protein